MNSSIMSEHIKGEFVVEIYFLIIDFYGSNHRLQGGIYVNKWAITEEWSDFHDPVYKILAEWQASV